MESREKIYQELNREIEYYSLHTQSQYRSHLSDYLEFVGPNRDWRDRDVLYNYTQKLKKSGKAQSHINYLIRGPIGALFRAYGLRIPIKLPRVSVSMIDLSARVSFKSEQIIQLIKTTIASGNKQWQNIMAQSTTFGNRATEIRMVRQEDVHPKKKTIVVHTLKGGLKAEHLVPSEVEKYIFGYDYPLVGGNEIYLIFHQIAKEAGIQNLPRKCYHAVRHGLATALIHESHIPQVTVYTFLRWKGSGMLGIYVTPYQPDIDEIIFKGHPFLKYWA